MSDDPLRAAVAAGALASEELHARLLRSIVEVARAIFSARASSIFLLDEETDELVFEAVTGEGEDTLLGQRIPSGKGIAGWVVVTRQPIVIEDVAHDPRFAQDVAESTGYVPRGLMAVPLLHDERALGVLEVLDRSTKFTLAEMDLLGMFANQAAIALDLLTHARRARGALEDAGSGAARLARIAGSLERLEGDDRAAGEQLLAALDRLLRRPSD